MFRKLPLCCIFVQFMLMVSNNVRAQAYYKIKKNTITIGGGYFRFYNIYAYSKGPFLPVMNANYSRRINKHFSVRAGYSYWGKAGMLKSLKPSVAFKEVASLDTKIGDRYASNNFKYIDVDVKYRQQFKRHSLGVAAGPSWTSFSNYFKESQSYIIRPNGEFHWVSLNTYGTHNNTALGATFSFDYSYTFWKNRINVGVDLRGRYYPDKVPFHLVYGVQLGYNF